MKNIFSVSIALLFSFLLHSQDAIYFYQGDTIGLTRDSNTIVLIFNPFSAFKNDSATFADDTTIVEMQVANGKADSLFARITYSEKVVDIHQLLSERYGIVCDPALGADLDGHSYGYQTKDGGYALCGMLGTTTDAYLIKTDSAGNVAAGVEQFGPSAALRVTVYPNPARDYFTLEGNYELPAVLELYDMMGRKVREFTVNGSRFTVDMQGWKRGMYLYRLMDSAGGVVSGKVVVE